MRSTLSLGIATAVAISAFSVGVAANAATVYTGNYGGFVDDSATAAYLAAQGAPTEHLNLSNDKNGNPLGNGPTVNGDVFSNNVTFFTGVNNSGGTLLSYSGSGATSEIGPFPGYNGNLDIDFTGNPVSAVGFGVVDPNVGISVYDGNGNLFGTYLSGPDTFDFFGIVGGAGETFSKVVLNNPFYAIQDIQYVSAGAVQATPEPASFLPAAFGAFGLLTLTVRKRMSSRVA